MGHGPSSFKVSDVKRALRAIKAAGQKATALEIEGGRVTIKLNNSNDTEDNNEDNVDINPWDKADL